MNIGTVVEGPTDRLVLKAIINHLYRGEHRYFDLQPTNSATFGSTGTGWKGVRRWCQETWQRQDSSLTTLISADTGAPLDLLIIHVDADITLETDLQEGLSNLTYPINQPCPPITPTVNNLKEVVARWLNFETVNQLPNQLILVVPAQDTENWTFVALFPSDPLCQNDDYECFQTGTHWPGFLLTLDEYGRILRRSSGRIRKSPSTYEQYLPKIVAAWPIVCEICSQADEFTRTLQTKITI